MLAAGLLLAAVGGCASSERRSLVSRTYNNVAARDNGYFLAHEKMKAIEQGLNLARVNDYNRVLPLFPVIDEPTGTRLTADMDDIIKKASIPIQYRPTSDWTDDSYLLLGQARYYKREFEDAAKTFKYVNSTSADLNARHEALVWLMRTFLALDELDNVAAVSNILDKETGTERNARSLFLTRAEYYQRVNEPKLAIENLEKAIPYIEEKNEQSRTRYVLAQLYQAAGDDKKAYAQLNQILKKNPPYELDFYSKLMLGQVSDLNLNDRARLDKYFAKLLKDPNNREYTDKIYYEMGRLEYRQQRYPAALALLEQSVRVPKGQPTQKAYTYLLKGRIYYENLQRYRLAAAYYDSTVQIMPKANPTYEAVAERAGILKDFAQQLTVVETQDSLQALARLAPPELEARLTQYAEAELAERQRQAALAAARQAREQERQLAQQQTAVGLAPGRDLQPNVSAEDFLAGNTGAKWYFDNPTALSTARNDFIRRWGDRPLQDNWRTVTQASNSPVSPQGGNVPVSVAGNGNTVVNGSALSTVPADAPDPQAQLEALVSQYRTTIPATPAQLAQSDAQTQEALYALGGIYNQQLREPARAIETYETLLRRYPQGPHTPETLYSLYLIRKESDAAGAEAYAARLRQAYPNSSYARLVADPEYLRRTSVANAKVAVLVDSAFAAYKRQDFKKTSATLDQARAQYPETDLNDQVAFLGALVSVRTQPPPTAKAAIEKFSKDYPESPLITRASTLLETYQKYGQGQIAGAMASTTEPGKSIFRPGEVELRPMRFARPTPVPAPPASPAPAAKSIGTPVTTPAAGAPTGTAPATLASPTTPTETPTETATTPVVVPVAPVPLTPAEEALAARRAAAQARARGRKVPAAPKKATPVPDPVPATPVPASPAPTTTAPASTTATPNNPTNTPATSPVATLPATPAPVVPAAPASPYKTDLAAGHSVVLVLAKDAPLLADLPAQLTAYNGRFYKSSNLLVRRQALNATEETIIIEGLANAKIAQSYALKLRGPQSPLSKLRGAGYQTLVVGIDNVPVLLREGKPEDYQRFYDQNYR